VQSDASSACGEMEAKVNSICNSFFKNNVPLVGEKEGGRKGEQIMT